MADDELYFQDGLNDIESLEDLIAIASFVETSATGSSGVEIELGDDSVLFLAGLSLSDLESISLTLG